MLIYLASPNTQQQAEHAAGMPVLLSYACYSEWLSKGYQESFARILVDSGAFSEFSTGKKIDLSAYAEWAQRWVGHADAIAGLDDIAGDWRRSLRHYQAFPLGFPTFHETDPPAILNDLVAMAQERNQWIGLGLLPPRENKERWVRSALDRIPDNLHVHGWAMRLYTHCRRLDSVDSTNWWRDAMKLRTMNDLSHLTYGECLEIVVKRYKRWARRLTEPTAAQPDLFSQQITAEPALPAPPDHTRPTRDRGT